MRGTLAIYRREMLSLWITPLAWVILVAFLLLQGISFYLLVQHFTNMTNLSIDSGPVQAYFGQSIFLVFSLLIICPALTMRLFAEERRSGNIEALMTLPVTPTAVVMGKYLATLSTYALMWLPTLLYIVILRKTGEVSWPVVGASYIGVFGVGAGYLAIGILMSAMSRSQLLAAILTVLVIFGLFMMGIGEYIFPPGIVRDVCSHVSVLRQMDDFSKGLVDLRRIVFDLSLTVLPLFLTVRVVDSWRQD